MGQPIHTISFRRRNLPHWYVADRPYFVTFRLKGTLPMSIVREYESRMTELLKIGARRTEIEVEQRRYFLKVEAILDDARAPVQVLRQPEIARLVMQGFDWLERERGWQVYAAVVMPNHVHCCLRSRNGRSAEMGTDIGSLKKYTGRRANETLGLKGHFWQSENFDHWCRSSAKVDASVAYIRDNPLKAGLVARPEEWPWVRVDRKAFPDL